MSLNDGISEIGVFLTWHDFVPNLFEAEFFGDTGDTQYSIPDVRFYITKFSMKSPELSLKKHELTKKWYVEQCRVDDTLTVTWREDAALSVWRYHHDWLRNFYDRVSDQYIVGSAGKKRTLIVKFQRFQKKRYPELKDDDLVTTFSFFFYGLVPTGNYDLSGGWDMSSDNATSYTVNYKYDYMRYEVKDQSLKDLFRAEY